MTYLSQILRTCAHIAPLALLYSGTAYAQPSAERSIELGASSRLEYESNAFKANDALGIPGAVKDSEQKLTLEAHLNIIYPVGRQSFFLDSSVGYDFHRYNERLDRERIRLSGGADLTLIGSCGARISGDFVRQQSDLADIVVSGVPGSVVNVENRWGATIDTSCGNIVGLVPGFRYRHEETTNSATLRKQSNVVSDDFTVSLGYSRPSLGTISIYGNYRDGRYPDRVTLIGGLPVDDGIRVYGAGAMFERNIGARLMGSVSFGYQHVDPRTPGAPKFSGVSWSGDVTWTPTDRLQSRIGIGRSAEQSNLFLTSYSIRTYLSWDTTFKLNQRVDLGASATFARRSFTVSDLVTGETPRRSDTTWGIRGTAGYRFARLFRISLDAAYEWRNSNTVLLRYNDTRVGLTLGVTL